MSDINNPYQSPEAPIIPEAQNSGVLSEKMLRYLKEASPWLRFMGILGFISCGLIAGGGLILIIAMAAVSSFTEELNQFPVWIFILIYLPMGLLYFFPSRFIYNFGTKIRNFQFSNSNEDLELAFKNNKSFWKFLGIMSIILLAFIPISIIMAILGGIMVGLSSLLS
ncbi:MAG: hypothetical protein LBH44_08135 [Treponema sp.]|nr:hypothetical protein [Treponema sp.]